MDNLPENVMIRKWVPQKEILSHPHVKLFVSHGGSFSSQESVCHGVPIACIPIFQ